jgi:hypothetical protein
VSIEPVPDQKVTHHDDMQFHRKHARRTVGAYGAENAIMAAARQIMEY